MLSTGGGSAGGANWTQSIWIWPLPPPGRLTFVCQWPAAGIELTRHDVDASLILDAATRAQVLFPDTGQSDSMAPVEEPGKDSAEDPPSWGHSFRSSVSCSFRGDREA